MNISFTIPLDDDGCIRIKPKKAKKRAKAKTKPKKAKKGARK